MTQNLPAAPRTAAAAARDKAKTSDLEARHHASRAPPGRRYRDSLPPVQARLLDLELALQDELSDAQQGLDDDDAHRLSNPSVWRSWRVWRLKVKIWLLGFRPPKNATHPRRAPQCPPLARLHLLWIMTVRSRMTHPKRPERISEGSWIGGGALKANGESRHQRRPRTSALESKGSCCP
jgi:hypothetical protein